MTRLSIAIPVFNEEAVVPELLQRVRAVLTAIPGGPHELLFVDDGSSDRTVQLLEAAAEDDPRIRIVVLSRNFGHQAAFSAALAHVSGDAIVLMDGDLQDAPEAIPEFVDRYREGYEVVYARRVRRKEGVLLRTAYSAVVPADRVVLATSRCRSMPVTSRCCPGASSTPSTRCRSASVICAACGRGSGSVRSASTSSATSAGPGVRSTR